MFNSKKIKCLEFKVDTLTGFIKGFKRCDKCNLYSREEDMKEVVFQAYSLFWSYSNGKSYRYYCKNCRPEYDYIDNTVFPKKYYKTISEHRVEVKAPKEDAKA